MNDLIEKLSNIRSQFNCFDENERDAYNTLSEAIKVLSVQTEPCEDAVSRADMLETYADLYDIFEDNDQIRKELNKVYDKLNALPSVTPRPDQYEDALKKIKNASFVGSDGLDYVETLQALDALKDAIGVTLHVTKISKHCSDFSDLDEVIECEDAVSRKEIQERLRRVIEHGVKTNGMHSISAENVLEFVSNMPSINHKI